MTELQKSSMISETTPLQETVLNNTSYMSLNKDNNLNNKNSKRENLRKKSIAMDCLNNKNHKVSTLTVSSIDYDCNYIENDLSNQSTLSKNSKDSLFYHEPYEVRHKQPIMGKTALLRRSQVDPSDSFIIQSIILNKYENTLNYYVNRMYSRRQSRMSNVEDENNDDTVNAFRDSPADLSALDASELNDSFVNKEFHLRHCADSFNDDCDREVLNMSTCSTEIIDVISTCSEYDPKRFLVNALGELNNENCNATVNTQHCDESVGTSHLSSLLSTNDSMKRKLKRKKSHDVLSEDCSENGSTDSIIEQYKQELFQQHSTIFQVTKALKYCKASKQFIAGKERIEAEKILLVATIAKEALIKEISIMESDTSSFAADFRCTGEVIFSDFALNLRPKPYDEKLQDCEEYFLLIMKCGKTVLSSDILREVKNSIYISKEYKFSELHSNFEVDIRVYSLAVENRDTNKDIYCPSPKSILKCNKNPKPTRFIPTENVAFTPLGKSCIKNTDIPKSKNGQVQMKWKLLSNSSLQQTFNVKINSNFQLFNKLNGFLTLAIDRGVINWNRRWCVLEGFVLKYWNYPSEESSEPIDIVDIRYCTVEHVALADRSTCARSRTLLLPIKYPNGLKMYFLSADSQAELELWENDINFVVRSLLLWGAMKNKVF
ncbi:unnamed protein product [Diabrotica balteata]|uniref:PH domain-containing protein n=1 Tax=Diabrotica balteata TaxID=107213 RepID=A0A9N9XD11_DIABA|nr:unnamed protein product [Diabrotica balteata]